MRMNLAMGDLASYAMGIEGAFSGWGLPFLLLAQAACEGSILSLLGFVAFCVAPFLLVVWLFAGRYKKIVTSLGARKMCIRDRYNTVPPLYYVVMHAYRP